MTPLVQSGRISLFAGYADLNTGSDSSKNQADYSLRSHGGLLGVRARANSKLTLGFFAGIDSGTADATYLNSTITGNAFGLFGVYTPKADGRLVATASVTAGDYKAHGTRATASGTSVFNHVDSTDYVGQVGVKYLAVRTPDYYLQPELQLVYNHAETDHFNETNAADALQALHVAGISAPGVHLNAAVNGGYALTDSLGLTANLGVSQDLDHAYRKVSANVIGESTVFSVRAPGMGTTQINVGVGANYSLTPQLVLRASYEAGFSSDAKTSSSFFIGTALSF